MSIIKKISINWKMSVIEKCPYLKNVRNWKMSTIQKCLCEACLPKMCAPDCVRRLSKGIKLNVNFMHRHWIFNAHFFFLFAHTFSVAIKTRIYGLECRAQNSNSFTLYILYMYSRSFLLRHVSKLSRLMPKIATK